MLIFFSSFAFASLPAAPEVLDAPSGVIYVAGAELHWVPEWYDWNTLRWVEGYWRPATRPGYAWVEGGYDLLGVYQPGRWVVATPVSYTVVVPVARPAPRPAAPGWRRWGRR